LGAIPLSIADARRPPAQGGIPLTAGFYAWWALTGAIASVPATPHPLDPGWELLYVGIAPRDANSSQRLRTRVLDNHVGGNTGSSTFRFTLAALLREEPELDLHPEKRAKKYVLPKGENKDLSVWQATHLSITWCEVEAPWLLEPQIIEVMKPPLNLADNASHDFHRTVAEARSAFRAAATGPPAEG
jgi:hypothetical protein